MSLRLLWLNAFIRSPMFTHNIDEIAAQVIDPLMDANLQERTKAIEICDQILKNESDYDIIALCEVWDEDCKDVFEVNLRGKYPYCVRKIAGEAKMGFGLEEDSGLMLFSRYKFEDFNSDTVNVEKIRDTYGITSICPPYKNRCPIYFIQYGARAILFQDYMAAKGAAVVRVYPGEGYFYNIIWTHLQNEHPEVRNAQLHSLWSLVKVQDDTSSAYTSSGHPFKPDHFKLLHEETYIVGDFNINGCNIPPEDGEAAGVCPGEYSEWSSQFGGDGNSYPMYDVWARTTSPWDCGKTNGNDRIDYALANGYDWWNGNLIDFFNQELNKPIPDHTIVQHITRPIIGQSDHRALLLDICPPSEACFPRAATVIDTIKSQVDRIFEGSIKYPGSMHWYKINQPGTYTFMLPKKFFGIETPSKLAIDVYEKEDLTYPIGAYEGWIREGIYSSSSNNNMFKDESVIEVTYNIPEAPFYFRVYSRNRDWSTIHKHETRYYFLIHKNSGLSKDDAFVLEQNYPIRDLSLDLDPNAIGSGGPIWLRLDIGYAKSGLEQDITLHLENYSGENARLEFLDENDEITDSSPSNSGWSNDPNIPLEISKKMKGPAKERYLRIQRVKNSQVEFKIQWETNLQFFVGKAIKTADQIALYIEDETGWDSWGSDEASIEFFYDSYQMSGFHQYFDEANTGDLFRIDYGFYDSVYGGLPVVGFINKIIAVAYENDIAIDDKGILDILPLASGQDPNVNIQFGIPLGGGTYQLRYSKTRFRPNLDPDPSDKKY